jgi:hypothetical protein
MDGIARVYVEERACHGSNEDAKAGYAGLTAAGLCKIREHAAGKSTWNERVGYCMSMRSVRALEKKST